MTVERESVAGDDSGSILDQFGAIRASYKRKMRREHEDFDTMLGDLLQTLTRDQHSFEEHDLVEALEERHELKAKVEELELEVKRQDVRIADMEKRHQEKLRKQEDAHLRTLEASIEKDNTIANLKLEVENLGKEKARATNRVNTIMNGAKNHIKQRQMALKKQEEKNKKLEKVVESLKRKVEEAREVKGAHFVALTVESAQFRQRWKRNEEELRQLRKFTGYAPRPQRLGEKDNNGKVTVILPVRLKIDDKDFESVRESLERRHREMECELIDWYCWWDQQPMDKYVECGYYLYYEYARETYGGGADRWDRNSEFGNGFVNELSKPKYDEYGNPTGRTPAPNPTPGRFAGRARTVVGRAAYHDQEELEEDSDNRPGVPLTGAEHAGYGSSGAARAFARGVQKNYTNGHYRG
ncbi:hypothetical protein BDV96DRAFT_582337 [Lophiotrema nucula]|uniref:Uncharacterized protein n=1 Tax=Lophiotrema nucula TaxID=690887 RepID=A0A6A5YX90_9PLEO|nr:hypothetical protein BDV96DRAFT_582337 [Lophiotrema nucula]